MEPTRSLIDALRREKIEQARRMTPAQRLAAGGELFDYACEASKVGIRMQHPEADAATVLDLLKQRVELGARLELKRVIKRDHAGRH